jgi:hypothetical protein
MMSSSLTPNPQCKRILVVSGRAKLIPKTPENIIILNITLPIKVCQYTTL